VSASRANGMLSKSPPLKIAQKKASACSAASLRAIVGVFSGINPGNAADDIDSPVIRPMSNILAVLPICVAYFIASP